MPRSAESGNVGPSNAAIVGGAVIAGVMLFAALEARRTTASAPAVSERGLAIPQSEAPPPLYIPPPPAVALPAPIIPIPPIPYQPILPMRSTPQPPVIVQQPLSPAALPVPSSPTSPRDRPAGGAALVFDGSQPRGATDTGAAGQSVEGATSGNDTATRVRAGTIASRATTVVQGTLIPAVLETALNSSRPGFARALVQRDVRGFDGTRVLIPRGSRLIGEYRAEIAPGQKRALVNWSRLIRPDGVTIAIGSPSTDPIGGAGMKASVNTHFFERFSSAILQSVLDVGVTLAARSADSSLILLPGSIQTARSAAPAQIPPTLKVKQGTSMSVFVARDLDFTEYETP